MPNNDTEGLPFVIVPPAINEELPALDDYSTWFKNHVGGDLANREAERLYTLNAGNARTSVTAHQFFAGLDAHIEETCQSYKQEFHSELLMTSLDEITLSVKTYASVVNKSYRENILNNGKFPQPPEQGWVTPANWYGKLNDIIRYRIVCKFIDGPEFLAKSLCLLAENCGVRSETKQHNKEGGYYAYHFYVWIPVGLLVPHENTVQSFDTEMRVEIQLTTQLQEVLYDLTHDIYEELRISSGSQSSSWQWDYSSPRFKPSYMGHTLHMLEAIILEVRDKNMESRNNGDQ